LDRLQLKEFTFDTNRVIQNHNINEGGAVQRYIDSECLRLMDQFTPRDQGNLIANGITNTVIGSGEIKYRNPYARRMYYNPQYSFQGAPQRGAYWFERMKQQYKDSILDGAMRFT